MDDFHHAKWRINHPPLGIIGVPMIRFFWDAPRFTLIRPVERVCSTGRELAVDVLAFLVSGVGAVGAVREGAEERAEL